VQPTAVIGGGTCPGGFGSSIPTGGASMKIQLPIDAAAPATVIDVMAPEPVLDRQT
jgi:hypothetical protein